MLTQITRIPLQMKMYGQNIIEVPPTNDATISHRCGYLYRGSSADWWFNLWSLQNIFQFWNSTICISPALLISMIGDFKFTESASSPRLSSNGHPCLSVCQPWVNHWLPTMGRLYINGARLGSRTCWIYNFTARYDFYQREHSKRKRTYNQAGDSQVIERLKSKKSKFRKLWIMCYFCV